MFDVTLTDKEFKKDFVNRDAEWLAKSEPTEPDLRVDGFKQSMFSRLIAFLSGRRDVAR